MSSFSKIRSIRLIRGASSSSLLEHAGQLYLPAISAFEIGQKTASGELKLKLKLIVWFHPSNIELENPAVSQTENYLVGRGSATSVGVTAAPAANRGVRRARFPARVFWKSCGGDFGAGARLDPVGRFPFHRQNGADRAGDRWWFSWAASAVVRVAGAVGRRRW